MPIIASFDGPNRIFNLDPANIVTGVLTFAWQDFYSEVVIWRNTVGDRWIQPVRATGGDVSGVNQVDSTRVFLMNDWRLALPNTGTQYRVTPTGAVALDNDTNTNGQFFSFDDIVLPTRVTVEYQTPFLVSSLEVPANNFTDTQAAQLAILASLVELSPDGVNYALTKMALIEVIMRQDANESRDLINMLYTKTIANQGGPYKGNPGDVIFQKNIVGDIDADNIQTTD